MLLSINALVYYVGLPRSIAFLGMIIGTTVWVFFLDRGSVAMFSVAVFVGMLTVAGFALSIALRPGGEDE